MVVMNKITEKTNHFQTIEPEYLEFRCCMCPNLRNKESERVCPGIAGTPHPEASPCRFVKAYIDERGWKYMVMSGIGENTFKARYQKPEKSGSNGWKGLGAVPWRTTFDEAQTDLNLLAKEKGWAEWDN